MGTLLDYIQYRFFAKSRHGIHSPFVYEFVEKYLYQEIESSIYQPIENIRVALLKDKRQIEFEDFGAGSKKIRTAKPSVKNLAKNSLKPKKYAKLIAQLAQYIQAENIIELGTSLGTTTLYISALNPKAKIYTLEGSPELAKIAQKQFDKLNARNINLIVGNFDQKLPDLLNRIPKPDLYFIDGNHTYEATIRYFKLALKHSNGNTLFIFDDINWSDGMKKAWSEIKSHPQVSISMDFFYLGVVSINPNYSKEDFVIRY
ncbi:MAG: class I SAM-dependent methyltransferase [Bacteroidales bacterium]|nr:class I SAM-dependent methyltransferase [Bacteroidales bacterium]